MRSLLTNIVDPVFGTLEFRGSWVGEVDVPFLNKTLELDLEGPPEDGPSQAQRDFWVQFIARQDLLRRRCSRTARLILRS